MKIVWSNGAKKAFSRIDERYQRRIEVKLAELDDRSAPRPDIKKISATENHFRLRVGDYRIIYTLRDDNGKTQYVVIPYHEYFRMCSQMAEIDDETDDDLEDIEVEHDSLDDVELPGDVCSIMTWQNVSLQAAWRILRGLSQQEVAEKLGISQSAVSQLEALDSRPQKRTREKLAAIYGCKQEQISLYLPKEG